MTATTVHASSSIARRGAASAAFAGFRPLFRKDIAEWGSGKRAWIVLGVTAVFMALGAANAAINAWVIKNVPEAAQAGADKLISLAPLDNVLTAVAAQIFILAAIFAAMSLLVVERDRGTLSWIASKPVSRTSIWVSKWASATAVLIVIAAVVPMIVTTVVAAVLYGPPPVAAIVVVTIGMAAAIALFVAVTLAASTFVASQPAAAAIGFAVFLAPAILLGILPAAVAPFFPTSIVNWSVGLATGDSVGVITPIAWAVSLVVLGVVSARRMGSLEL